MSELYKLVGIRYPKYHDFAAGRKVVPVVKKVTDKSQLRGTIESMLFDGIEIERMNAVLVKWADKMYVCEALDREKRIFGKSEVDYHPYQDLL